MTLVFVRQKPVSIDLLRRLRQICVIESSWSSEKVKRRACHSGLRFKFRNVTCHVVGCYWSTSTGTVCSASISNYLIATELKESWPGIGILHMSYKLESPWRTATYILSNEMPAILPTGYPPGNPLLWKHHRRKTNNDVKLSYLDIESHVCLSCRNVLDTLVSSAMHTCMHHYHYKLR